MKRIAWPLAAAAVSSGCSFTLSRPPSPHTIAHAPCPGVGAPALDSYLALSSAATAVIGFGLASEDDSEIDDGGFRALGAISLGLAALYGLSASHGFKQARACNEMKSAFLASSPPRAPGAVWVAPSLPWPPPPPVVIEHEEETETVETRTTTRSRTVIVEP